jgi:two-component system sensor histidine kinase KdpD
MERIARAAQRQKRLVEDLLLVTVVDAGKLELKPSAIAPHAIVAGAVEEVQATYNGQIVAQHGRQGPLMIADPDRAHQILANLMDNAAKYSEEGQPLSVAWEIQANMIAIRISDRGPGISVESRKVLFTRFGRVQGSTARAGRSGTGLGLHLSRSLAEAMGGSLELESTGPGGSTFVLRLPAAVDQAYVSAF